MTRALLAGGLVMLLAAYHLIMGLAALFAPRIAGRLVGVLYGAALDGSPQLRYATSMIGALAVAVGMFLAFSFLIPDSGRPTMLTLVVLQLGRLFCRIRDRKLLTASLGVTPARNALASALLGAEIVILTLAIT